jgi:hypothetical protein
MPPDLEQKYDRASAVLPIYNEFFPSNENAFGSVVSKVSAKNTFGNRVLSRLT